MAAHVRRGSEAAVRRRVGVWDPRWAEDLVERRLGEWSSLIPPRPAPPAAEFVRDRVPALPARELEGGAVGDPLRLAPCIFATHTSSNDAPQIVRMQATVRGCFDAALQFAKAGSVRPLDLVCGRTYVSEVTKGGTAFARLAFEKTVMETGYSALVPVLEKSVFYRPARWEGVADMTWASHERVLGSAIAVGNADRFTFGELEPYRRNPRLHAFRRVAIPLVIACHVISILAAIFVPGAFSSRTVTALLSPSRFILVCFVAWFYMNPPHDYN